MHIITRALLRLERTMNSLCHYREGGKGGEGRGGGGGVCPFQYDH